MPKLKTHKSLRKRFRVTGSGKLIRRASGQDHFNSRESSNTTTRKRRDKEIAKVDYPAVRKRMPYV